MKFGDKLLPFDITYHPDVKQRDIPKINGDIRLRIKRAIETRLLVSPQEYGEPLRKTLKGYWKLRVGDYRVVFKVDASEILIFGLCHRTDVYARMEKRQ